MSARRETRTVLEWQQRGVLLVEDGNHGENRPRKDEFGSEGVAFIRAADMANGNVLFGSAQKINAAAQARVRKGIGSGGDILISHKGTIGRVARVPENSPPFVCSPQTTFWRVLDPQRLDAGYLYVLMRSSTFQGEFAVRSGETDMAGYVSLTSQRALQITVPPLAEQRSIAAVLSALDDKIELNRRMSATLEEMARALFRSWFVDFDPVQAKARGEAPAHMDPATAALFPDRFGENGLPEGWRREPVGQHINVRKGLSYKGEGLCDESDGVPLHNLNSIYEGGGYKDEGIKFYRGDHKPRHEVRPGDLVVANTEQGFDELLIGHSALIPEWLGPSGIFSHHLYKIELKTGSPLSKEWWYLALSCSLIGATIRSFSNGTTVNMLPADAFELPLVAVPSLKVVSAMDSLVRPMLRKQGEARAEARTLAALRDALLPKLMSGEIRVRDAARLAAEAV